MAEPARKTPTARRDDRAPDEEPGITLLRWVEHPDGTREQLELPLTPERFLNPQVGDQIMQGERHGDTASDLYRLLKNHFRPQPEVLILFDVKHLFGPDLPGPGPDVSIIRGSKKGDRFSFDVEAEGVLPCLIIEVVSPLDSKIRWTDLDDKVKVYQRAGIPEYVIIDSTLKDRRYRLLGYRLDRAGHYRPIALDAEGRMLSETTGLWFKISPDGERVLAFEHPSGRQLLNLDEATDQLLAAEAEIARLKAELDRLRGGGA
ncbi:MAG TPA: Uma2 family endonuclease [Thermoanaerobaculia bacterium]|nr:Uma2 family endonuclease [Thermoanaerobaculia bacterium]